MPPRPKRLKQQPPYLQEIALGWLNELTSTADFWLFRWWTCYFNENGIIDVTGVHWRIDVHQIKFPLVENNIMEILKRVIEKSPGVGMWYVECQPQHAIPVLLMKETAKEHPKNATCKRNCLQAPQGHSLNILSWSMDKNCRAKTNIYASQTTIFHQPHIQPRGEKNRSGISENLPYFCRHYVT